MTRKLKYNKKIPEELREENRKLKEKIKELMAKLDELLQKKEKKLDQEENSLSEKLNKNLERILKKHKSPWETKLALFNIIKSLELEESPLEENRENHLLESCLLNHLAKESMKKYKKVTAQSFSEVE